MKSDAEIDVLMAKMLYPRLAAYAVPKLRDALAITHEEAIKVWQEAKKRLPERLNLASEQKPANSRQD
jgi:hypothetical protein